MTGRSGGAKLLSRLFLVVLVTLVGFLYVDVIRLQKENRLLQARVDSTASLRKENEALRKKLADAKKPVASPQAGDWIESARQHIQLAEGAVSKGNFGEAIRQGQFANLALSRAADQASAGSRATVDQLRSHLSAVQSQASSLLRRFGG